MLKTIELKARLKKLLMIVILLSLVSCTPLLKSDVINTPASTSAIEPSAAPKTLPVTTATAKPSVTTTSPEVTTTQLPACPTAIKRSAIPTLIPEATKTQPVFSVVQREYNPSEWKALYNKDSVWKTELGSKEQMWILTGEQVGYFDGKDWILYSEKDYGFPDSFTDMAIASDGTMWLTSPQAISHYRDGHWNVYSIPDAQEISSPRLAIYTSNLVWLAFSGCHCKYPIRIFDGTNWSMQSLWTFGEVEQLLFTPDGILWASNEGLIGQYNGKTWKLYGRIKLWPRINDFNFRIASDSQGNIFGIDYMQEWIVKINRDGSISKVPFDFVNYEFIPQLMRLFIDKQGRIWTNACYKNNSNSCLAYYQDNQWISFKNLPFLYMTDMKELSDGTLLVATTQGLFQYKSEN